MIRQSALLLVAAVGFAATAFPHSGGLDRDGCHHVRKTGEYHCHRVQTRSKTKVKARLFSPVAPLLSATAMAALPAGSKAVDGDAIKFKDERANVRLVGCDTPEIRGAECEAERKLAQQAKVFLQKTMDMGGMDLEYVPCSCPPATEGTLKCNHGRACVILRVGGRNVCDVMIDEGLALPFICDATSCPTMPKWCEQIPK